MAALEKQTKQKGSEQITELQQKIDEDEAVLQDEDASPSDKEAAQERVAERNEGLTRLQTQIAEREGALPLCERVNQMLKKYGFTIIAILLAAGVTIGAVVGAITNSLKALGKGLGNGLKEIGRKTASLLPSLLSSVVSFIFKTADQAIRFLADHAWLLVLAVVAFVMERDIKKNR